MASQDWKELKVSNSRTKNTLLNTMGGLMVKLITILTAFVTRTVFIKTLGIQYAGVSGVFTDILTVLSFAEMGIGSAIVYALYKPIAEDDRTQIAKLMNVYKRIYTSIAGVILVLGLCLIPFLKYIIKDVPGIVEDIRVIYCLYLCNTASSYLLIYRSTFLTAAQKDYMVSKMKVTISIIKAVSECIILLVFHSFILYLLHAITIQIIQNVMIARIAEREYPVLKEKSNLTLNMDEKKQLFADVKALFLYKVSGTILTGTDSLIISSFIGTSVVGILGNYNLISNQVYMFVMQIFTATSASIGNLAATSTAGHQEKVFNKMLFLCFWIYCFCSSSLWTLFNPFMLVWQGKELLFSESIVALLIIDFWMKGMLSPISQFRTSNGLFVQGKYRPLIMAIINLIVSIFLVKRMGIAGVILGRIIARLVTQLWYDPYLIYKLVFKQSVFKYYWKYLLYGGVTVGCCYLSQNLLSLVSVPNMIFNVMIGAIISLIIPNCIVAILFFKTTEFKEVVELFINIVRRRV